MSSITSVAKPLHENETWRFVQNRMEQRDFLGARGVLALACEMDGHDVALARVLGEFITNYHSFLAQLTLEDNSSLNHLLPNTPTYRDLTEKVKAEVNLERDRLVAHISKARIEPRHRLPFYWHQVLYWLSHTDGLRVNYWCYHGIRTLESFASVGSSLESFRSHLRSELLSAMNMVPQTAAALKSGWTKSNYEGVEELRYVLFGAGISQADADVFLPRFDVVFGRRNLRSVH